MAENNGNKKQQEAKIFEFNSHATDKIPSVPIDKIVPKQINNNSSSNQGGGKH